MDADGSDRGKGAVLSRKYRLFRPQARAGVEIPRPAGKFPDPLFALMRGRELKCPYAAMRVFVAWNGASSRGNIAATCHDAILRQEDAGDL